MIRQNILQYAAETKVKSRAYKNFTRGINSKATLCDYTDYLRKFMKFHKMDENYDAVVKFETIEIDNMISDYLDSLIDRNLKGITQRAHLMGIERLFIMNDCIWHKERIRKSITQDDEIPGGNIPITTEEIQNMLQCTKSIRSKAFIHYLASTGSRPAGMTDPILRMKHLEEMLHQKKKCYGIKIYDGSKSGYWVFLTPEATTSMDRWFQYRKTNGEEITSESPIFVTIKKTNTKNVHLTDENARFIMYDLIKSSGLHREKVSSTRYDKAVMYMFRKRFNTILKLENSVNSNIAEKLMAHKKGLDGTYLQPTREECFTEFVKAIPELTVDQTQRKTIQLEILQDEKDILKLKLAENKNLEDQLKIERAARMQFEKEIKQTLAKLREEKLTNWNSK